MSYARSPRLVCSMTMGINDMGSVLLTFSFDLIIALLRAGKQETKRLFLNQGRPQVLKTALLRFIIFLYRVHGLVRTSRHDREGRRDFLVGHVDLFLDGDLFEKQQPLHALFSQGFVLFAELGDIEGL